MKTKTQSKPIITVALMMALFVLSLNLNADDKAAAKAKAEAGEALAEVKAELKQEIKQDKEIQEDLLEPDGCAIEIGPDYWRIFAQGSGAFDFNDVDDKRNARKDALLDAKAHLAKFLKEEIKTAEVMSKVRERAKKLSKKNGETLTEAHLKQIQRNAAAISNNAEAILAGFITLETTIKTNANGSGTVYVKGGISNKTMAARDLLVGKLANLDKLKKKGLVFPGDGKPGKETRKKKTDF